MDATKNFFMYFIKSTPGTEFKYYIPLALFAALLLILAVISSVVYRNRKKTDFAYKRLFKNLSRRLILIAILVIVYLLVRYENIPYFSMRLWIYMIGALFLYFAYRYIKTYKIDYPKEKTNFTLSHPEKKNENRYLPNKRR